MKHKIIVGALLSLLSSASFAQMTLDDVNRNLDTYDRYVPPQSEMDYRWNSFNAVPDESGNGSNKIISRYSVSNGTKRLQPTSTHICVVGSAGGEYRR
ncbi:hypothetical protein ACPV5G_21460, partial [Photobacterium damselae]|uniref:hypothetical protein n=1 Tax=Photobacterium damselae TaxID=38293 RepID=UPI0040683B02